MHHVELTSAQKQSPVGAAVLLPVQGQCDRACVPAVVQCDANCRPLLMPDAHVEQEGPHLKAQLVAEGPALKLHCHEQKVFKLL